jgi:ribosomal protein S27AE
MDISNRSSTNKCPKCSEGGQSFMILSDELYGCFKCGCVFVPKEARDSFREHVRASIKAKKVHEFVCPDCSFKAKSKAGLMAHMRTHAFVAPAEGGSSGE